MKPADRAGVPAAEVVGIDHVFLTVRSLDAAVAFYDVVLRDTLGFRKSDFTLGDDPHVQYYNRHFGIVARSARAGTGPHDPYAPGLHYLCLRVDAAADVDRVAAALAQRGIVSSAPRLYPEYAPDYYAVFLVDPDGIRLEVTNFRAERRERLARWADEDARGLLSQAPVAKTAMADGVVCRDARPEDHDTLARIFLECRRLTFHWLSPDTLSLDDLARETVGERIVVAEDDAGRLLGFVAVWDPDRFVHHLFVDPAHQRTGIGTRLLATLRDGVPLPYRLKCVAANAPARRFYAARGWREVDRGEDAAGEYLVLELSPGTLPARSRSST